MTTPIQQRARELLDAHVASKGNPTVPECLAAITAALSAAIPDNRVRVLEDALRPFAEQATIEEIIAGACDTPGWIDASVERRIEMIGERKRENTANILRARTALSTTEEEG